ncbi:hypothetical protein JYG30_04135 [Fibrella sp. USSR17]
MQNYIIPTGFYNQSIRRESISHGVSYCEVGIAYEAESVVLRPDLFEVICLLWLPGQKPERIKTGFKYTKLDGDEKGISPVKNPVMYKNLVQLRQAIWLSVAYQIRVNRSFGSEPIHDVINCSPKGNPPVRPVQFCLSYLLAITPEIPCTIEQQRTDMGVIYALAQSIDSPFHKK